MGRPWFVSSSSKAPRRRLLRSAMHRCDGSVLVETAVATIVMMMAVYAIMEISLAFYTSGMVSETAREGVRYAIVHGSTCATGTQASCTASASAISSYVQGIGYPTLGAGALKVVTTWPDTAGNCATQNAPGCRVQIAVSINFPVHIPLLPHRTLPLSSSAIGYILQ